MRAAAEVSQISLTMDMARDTTTRDVLDRNFTPDPLAQAVFDDVFQHTMPEVFLEGCAGDGAFLRACQRRCIAARYAFDVDEKAKGLDRRHADIAHVHDIRNVIGDGLFPTNLPRVVVMTNPPFSSKKKPDYIRAKTITQALIDIGRNGWVVLIIPAAWLHVGGTKWGWLHDDEWRADEIVPHEERAWGCVRETCTFIRRPPALRLPHTVLRRPMSWRNHPLLNPHQERLRCLPRPGTS